MLRCSFIGNAEHGRRELISVIDERRAFFGREGCVGSRFGVGDAEHVGRLLTGVLEVGVEDVLKEFEVIAAVAADVAEMRPIAALEVEVERARLILARARRAIDAIIAVIGFTFAACRFCEQTCRFHIGGRNVIELFGVVSVISLTCHIICLRRR